MIELGGFFPSFAEKLPSPIKPKTETKTTTQPTTMMPSKTTTQPTTMTPSKSQPTQPTAKMPSKTQPSNYLAKALALKVREKSRLQKSKKKPHNSQKIDVDALPDTKRSNCHWVLGLSKGDEQILLSGGWLNDNIVNASQKLIAESFPCSNGFQKPFMDRLCHMTLKDQNLFKLCTQVWTLGVCFHIWV